MSRPGPLVTCRLTVTGRVQGVGYRPFVYRLAHNLGIHGQVYNAAGEVQITAEATASALDEFEQALIHTAPPLARPTIKCRELLPKSEFESFSIRESCGDGPRDIHVPPDQFVCEDCLAEMTDPGARRYRYPFINCTQCGPRYTIINAMPYDRPNTSMKDFPLCEECRAEYTNPLDRRFHAQPLACPACGPILFWRSGSETVSGNADALSACITGLRQGAIVAIRGVGGYHLVCDAAREDVVLRLRERKHRPAKPLAIMVPWTGPDGLDEVRRITNPSSRQLQALTDPARPIVLVNPKPGASVAPSLSPGLNEIGIMLPYSPLHHWLLDQYSAPLVATSGNISGEPVITDPVQAESRLGKIADSFLHHNRPIVRPADDPVIREIAGRTRPIRLGRGNAPAEWQLPFEVKTPLLAVGAAMKNTVALAEGHRVIVSPHIGDLSSRRSREVFNNVIEDLQTLYGIKAEALVCDAHPDYPNTRWARDSGLPVSSVYHHHAHASALAGEFDIDHPMLVFTWDGLGLGEDGTLWGGEALVGTPGHWHRAASFRPFRLPGGDRVIHEPWRTALAMTWESKIHWAEAPPFPPLLLESWSAGFNSPLTSAVGRLLDAATVFVGILHNTSYEGEAPIRLEAACDNNTGDERSLYIDLPNVRDPTGIWRADWSTLVEGVITSDKTAGQLASMIHESLARSILQQAELVCGEHAIRDVGLTGGVFQNRRLARRALELLTEAGFNVHIPEVFPVNDASISFGQIIEAARNDP